MSLRASSMLGLLVLLSSGCGEPWYLDEDGDGFGTERGEGARPDVGAASIDGDCDDADGAVHPDAPEICDGVDDDCDGELLADEGDADGDGYVACQLDSDATGTLAGGDCDDADDAIHPDADEGCDGIDTDCDGSLGASELDGDGDGYVGCAAEDWRGDPTLTGGDCDDTLAAAHPGATEACDGVDTDCDGVLPPSEEDGDGDGHVACSVGDGSWYGPAGTGDGDCDDADPTRSAGLPELCNGRDDDCDGIVGAEELDGDGDGYVSCALEGPWYGDPAVTDGGDCDDTHAVVHPGQPEVLDGADDDCDGVLLPDEVDDDGDGYVETTVTPSTWLGASGTLGDDCDDASVDVHPGALELCDGLDDDCDGRLSITEQDLDGDGFVMCAWSAGSWQGSPSVTGGGDCGDTDPAVHPGAAEICDYQDDDCDGRTDDEDPNVDRSTWRTFFRDDDDDGFGVTTDTVGACALPDGYAPAGDDCDDTERHVHPFAREDCDGIDNDCNGLADDEDPELDPLLTLEWFEDLDRDGYGDGTQPALVMCDPPDPAWAEDPRDCDDTDPDIHYGAPERCNGIDDDCDTHPDLPGSGGLANDGAGLGCDMCTGAADFDPADIHLEVFDPCALDPLANDLCGSRQHRVRWRTDTAELRPELFLFLPPSTGNFNQDLLTMITQAGYRTIGFGQSNEVHVDICETDPDPLCSQKFGEEGWTGLDVSPHLDIEPHDSVEVRLAVLLARLDTLYPGEGWVRYRDPVDGRVVWDDIIIAAWSKAAVYALYGAAAEPASGMLLMSNPNNPLTFTVQTPTCRNFAIYHEDEWIGVTPDAASFESAFRSIGMDGPTLDLDTATYPWPDAQIFTTGTYEYQRDDCTAHKSIAYDDCLDESELFRPYVDLFCLMGEPDPATCP
ncbi:MAG: putative metal-binding motif-containing protein [Myxococcales bacterium]|nr:putative metal-binding motif-containing protein [Myxococcales bacterium]